jgi:hypothetical protein
MRDQVDVTSIPTFYAALQHGAEQPGANDRSNKDTQDKPATKRTVVLFSDKS